MVQYQVDFNTPSISAQFEQQTMVLPALWLRERCQDEQSLDKVTQQRLFDPHQLDAEIRLTAISEGENGQLRLSFSDGYTGDYDLSHFEADFDKSDSIPKPIAWTNSIDKSAFYIDFEMLKTESGLKQALTCFLQYGAIILQNVPRESGKLLEVGELFGHIRETNFGKFFEVVSSPNSTDLAYRAVALAPHTDNPYREPVPGIQLLHCLENRTSDGLSTLVDSLSVLQRLEQEDPVGFELLRRVPIRYRYRDADIELVERRTMIDTDVHGSILGIAYSPRLDYLPLLGDLDLKAFHRARKRLGQLLASSEFEWRFRLEPGELQMFHNSRVLHGRTGFNPDEGMRHLQGAYIDLDGPKGRYRALVNRQRVGG